ncbi:MAG: phage scaffolding protein [Clostridiales bacterium]|nr:phage scaffolding protein [Clostridiales bacterium]
MKLEELLGPELYQQVQAKIDKANEGQEDKLKHIRYADLSEGGYVSKDKYASLETDLTGKTAELQQANDLIAELKKSAGQDTAAQQKISEYESTIASLRQENEALRVDNALRFALAQAGGVDVDYLVYKAKEKGELKLEEDGKLKGESDLISGLKTQLPNMFSQPDSGGRQVLDNPLPQGDKDKTVTREQFRSMGYAQRLQLKKDDPEQYNNLLKG